MNMKQIDPRADFGGALVLLARRWRRAVDEALARAGHGDASWVPLVHLARSGGGICQRDLADRAGLDVSTLVRLLDTLGERGLVDRRHKEGDRRVRLLDLTPAGQRAVAEIQRALLACETELTAGIDSDDLAVALRLFGRIDTNLARLMPAGVA